MAATFFYRVALRCYPASFRRHYGDDLIAAFEDLRADRGFRVACWRTMVDLMVTVPKYRLRNEMFEHRARPILGVLAIMLAFAGVAVMLAGAWPISLGFLVVAMVILVSQRSTLAPSIHVQQANKRRQILIGAILAMVVFACLVALYLADIGDDHVNSGALMGYNIAGLLSVVSAVVLTVVGLRTHHEPPPTPHPVLDPSAR